MGGQVSIKLVRQEQKGSVVSKRPFFNSYRKKETFETRERRKISDTINQYGSSVIHNVHQCEILNSGSSNPGKCQSSGMKAIIFKVEITIGNVRLYYDLSQFPSLTYERELNRC